MLKKDHKPHSKPQAGRKAEKKKLAEQKANGTILKKGKNAKAFTFKSYRRAIKQRQRSSDLKQKKMHDIKVNRTTEECTQPPIFVAVIGSKGSGKTTLIKSLVKHYTKYSISESKGPITCVTGKKRRVTFLEVPINLHALIDAAKICDLALLVVDASFGFEMEIFEFLNAAQIHGFPRVMGVLTHLDKFTSTKTLRRVKKEMKHRFWEEIYEGAKLFYFSGIIHGRYPNREVLNLTRFISVLKFRPLTWRNAHPYLVADRYEDITDPGSIQDNEKIDRKLVFYGWVRGTNLQHEQDVHFLGVGDFKVSSVERIEDPCPLTSSKKKKLDNRDKLIYAPMSDIENISYDKDAMWIKIKHNQLNYTKESELEKDDGEEIILPTKGEGEEMVQELQSLEHGLDEKMSKSEIQLFSNGASFNQESVKFGEVENLQSYLSNEDDVYSRMISDQVVSADGTKRVRVRFANSKELENIDDDSDSDDEEMASAEEGEESKLVKSFLESSEAEEEEEEEESSEAEEEEEEQDEEEVGEWGMENSKAWRENILSRAKERFKSKSIQQLVYGNQQEESDGDDEDEEEFFFAAKETKEEKREKRLVSSKTRFEDLEFTDWTLEENIATMKDRFVTGRWKEGSDAEDGSDREDAEDEDSVDFTGTAVKDITVEDMGNAEDETKDEAEERRKKAKEDMKRKFDTSYDNDGPEGEDHYSMMLRERDEQTARNIAEFKEDDEVMQAELRGYIPGTYVRVEVKGVPYEFVKHFNLNNPIVLGGIQASEMQLGFIQARFKKHRWHRALLKHNNPLTISMGWRRYQTLPIYSMEERSNKRYRMIKYTPEHQHCIAHFYGPLAPPGTGLIGYLRSDREQASFRVSATGTVLGMNAQFSVQKKLKLQGYPQNIKKNTCFIKGMFSSDLEASKFIGAKIRTVSKIRGMIKKVHGTKGEVRCTFEDRVRPSDIVFLRTWVRVEAEKFYNPVLSLLIEDGGKWKGMRTVGQQRYEKKIEAPKKKDSEYKPIERPKQRFAPFKISKRLEKDLPFKSKRKDEPKKSRNEMARDKIRKIVLTAGEKRKRHLLQEMSTITRERKKKKMQANEDRKQAIMKRYESSEKSRDQSNKEKRKAKYRAQGQKEKKKSSRKRSFLQK